MDNTFFSGLSTSVAGVVGMALIAVVIVAALILGSISGYRLYCRFVEYREDKNWHWEGGEQFKGKKNPFGD